MWTIVPIALLVREGEWTMWTMANRLYVKSGGACNSGHLEKRKEEKFPSQMKRHLMH